MNNEHVENSIVKYKKNSNKSPDGLDTKNMALTIAFGASLVS